MHSMSLINTEKLLRWLSATISGDFSHWICPHFRHSTADQRAPGEQHSSHRGLISGLISTPDLHLAELPRRGEVPAAISDSALVQPTPRATASASVTRAREPWRSGSPAVCLPLADRSHLSHLFLPNTEQYLAQGSYLNVDLTAQSKNRLVFL